MPGLVWYSCCYNSWFPLSTEAMKNEYSFKTRLLANEIDQGVLCPAGGTEMRKLWSREAVCSALPRRAT